MNLLMDMFLCQNCSYRIGSLGDTDKCVGCALLTYGSKLCLACALQRDQCQKCASSQNSERDESMMAEITKARKSHADAKEVAQNAYQTVINPMKDAVLVYETAVANAQQQYGKMAEQVQKGMAVFDQLGDWVLGILNFIGVPKPGDYKPFLELRTALLEARSNVHSVCRRNVFNAETAFGSRKDVYKAACQTRENAIHLADRTFEAEVKRAYGHHKVEIKYRNELKQIEEVLNQNSLTVYREFTEQESKPRVSK